MEKPVVMPGKFDGTGHLTEYLAHFELCRQASGWDDAKAGVFLGLSLTGGARRLLTGIEPASEKGFLHLKNALIARFQPPNQAAMYKALLRSKERGKGECLQAHAEEVERYTRLAYPQADMATVDVMAKDRFVESLRDQQLQLWIHQSTAATLLEAVQVGLHAEACMRPYGGAQIVRATGQTMGEEMSSLGEDARKERAENAQFRQTVTTALSGRGPASGVGKGGERPGDRSSRPRDDRPRIPLSETRCYHCAGLGHRRSNCPTWAAQMAAADAKAGAAVQAPLAPNASGPVAAVPEN